MSTKILLAGPGTGKTTKISTDFIQQRLDKKKILILSFTNATINDLLTYFRDNNIDIDGDNCMTLSKFSLKINPAKELHILNDKEEQIINKYSKKLDIEFGELCKVLGCITFEQMISNCNDFIETNQTYIDEQLGEFDLLIVDEYQDFNEGERKLINHLSKHIQETLILGDDDQSIYGFKNADPDGIIALYNDQAVEKIKHENVCFRCPPDVINACVNLIGRNKNRISKDWTPNKTNNGLSILQLKTISEAGDYITNFIKKINLDKLSHGIMVLTPYKFICEDLVKCFSENGTPFFNWYTDNTPDELVNKIWTLRAIYGKHRLLNMLLLAYSELNSMPKAKNKRTLESIKKIINSNVNDNYKIHEVFSILVNNQIVVDSFSRNILIEEYLKIFPDYKELVDLFNVGNEKDFHYNLEKLDSLIRPPQVFEKNKVNIMSIHKSKGLQANHVFVLGLVEGFLPKESSGLDTIEAQRRSFFVAMSRARDTLHLLPTIYFEQKYVYKYGDKQKFPFDPKTKMRKGVASRFLTELR